MLNAIILPARDEGEEVKLTISDVANEFDFVCVVDDGSLDDSCKNLPDNVDIVRNSVSKGPAFCRNCAFLYDVDCYVFADAHIRIKTGSLRDMCNKAIEKNSIMCASVTPLGGKREWIGYGGFLIRRNESIGISYVRGTPKERFSRITGLIGACYAVPSNIFRLIGGWPKTYCWGYNEQALSFAANMFGIAMYNDRDTLIAHKYKHHFNYKVRRTDTIVNRWIIHYLFFEMVNWEGYWKPIFEREHPRRSIRKAKELIATQEVQQARSAIQSKKVINDSQFFSLLNVEGRNMFFADRRVDGCR